MECSLTPNIFSHVSHAALVFGVHFKHYHFNSIYLTTSLFLQPTNKFPFPCFLTHPPPVFSLNGYPDESQEIDTFFYPKLKSWTFCKNFQNSQAAFFWGGGGAEEEKMGGSRHAKKIIFHSIASYDNLSTVYIIPIRIIDCAS